MKLSVAMITYNHEGYIGRAIESVLAQNVNFDYEIVIGEDCSTDSTRAVLEDFQRRYPDSIRLLLRDCNVGAMRNFAETVEACHGQYLAFLEGDDFWTSPDRLQKQVDFLDTHPECAIVCGRAQLLYENDMPDRHGGLKVYPGLTAGRYVIDDILTADFAPTATVVLRRRFLPTFPQWLFEMKMADWPLLTLTARSGFIQLMDEVMAVYRIHASGTWSSMASVNRHKESIRMLRALDKELEYRHHSVVRNTIARCYLLLAAASRLQKNWFDTGKYLFACMANGGWRGAARARTVSGRIGFWLIACWFEAWRTASALIRPIRLIFQRRLSNS